MDNRFSRLAVLMAAAILVATACASKPATAQADAMATAVAEAASLLLTQTAAASSPTPTITHTPSYTDTPTSTATLSGTPRAPLVLNFAECRFGPGPTYRLDSHISKGKGVELIGRGDVPGWYVIRNPYFHDTCWMQAADLKIYPGTDLTALPVMTPRAK